MNYTSHHTLSDLGYSPLPIVPGDKRPAIGNWTSAKYAPPAGYPDHGVGLRCGFGIVGVDIDVTETTMANALRDYVLSTFGETIYRIGKAPKVLLVYRAEPGLRKISSKRYDIGRIEILGRGQQFVAFGVHPDTKRPYTWPGMLGSVLDVAAGDLPLVTVEGLQSIVSEFERRAEAAGYAPKSKDRREVATVDEFDPLDPLDQKRPLGIDLDKSKTLLDKIDPDSDRDQWLHVGMALHHEYGGSPDGLQVWSTWSAKGAKYKAGEPEKLWDSFGRYTGRPITMAYIVKLTKGAVDPNFFRGLPWSTGRFVADPPGIPMVINGFLPRGVVSLFYSAGGAGKSTLIMYMAIKIALAADYDVDFLGHSMQGGKVVILTAEDPELILNRRFIAILTSVAEELDVSVDQVRETVDKRLSIISTIGKNIQLFDAKLDGKVTTTTYYDSLLDSLRDVQDLRLLIVDTRTRYSPIEGTGNVNATQEITHYERITEELRCSVMLLHHTNKVSRDGSQSGAQAYRDSTALFDSVRSAWYLRGLTDKEVVAQGLRFDATYLLLENSKNNYIPVNEPMIVERSGFAYKCHGVVKKVSQTDKKEQNKQQAYDKVVEILQIERGTWHSQAEIISIGREFRVSRHRIVEALAEAEEDGLVLREKDGAAYRYTLTDAGRAYKTAIED